MTLRTAALAAGLLLLAEPAAAQAEVPSDATLKALAKGIDDLAAQLAKNTAALQGEKPPASPPSQGEPPKPSTPEAKPPIDVQPAPLTTPPFQTADDLAAALCGPNARLADGLCLGPGDVRLAPAHGRMVIVDENLAVREGSARHLSELDPVTVVFVARKHLVCRYAASSDPSNKWEPSPIKIGGTGAAIDDLFKQKIAREGASPTAARRCEVDSPKDSSSPDPPYTATRFQFGPFTTNEVTLQLFRWNADFTAHDLEASVKLANHPRYGGWIDIAGVGAFHMAVDQDPTLVVDPATGVPRIQTTRRSADFDIAAFLKLYAKCNDRGRWFERVDLQASSVCVGFGTGVSIRDPLDRLYPVGVNVTFGGTVSVHALLSVSRVDVLPDGYAAGDAVAGGEAPRARRFMPGVAVGIGVDPMIAVTILKRAVGR